MTSVKNLLIGFLIFGAIMTGTGLFYGNIGAQYNVTVTAPAFNVTDQVSATVQTISNALATGSFINLVIGFFSMPAAIITTLLSSLTSMNTMLSTTLSGATGGVIAIPPWILSLIQVGVLVIIAFTILNIVSGRRDA